MEVSNRQLPAQARTSTNNRGLLGLTGRREAHQDGVWVGLPSLTLVREMLNPPHCVPKAAQKWFQRGVRARILTRFSPLRKSDFPRIENKYRRKKVCLMLLQRTKKNVKKKKKTRSI